MCAQKVDWISVKINFMRVEIGFSKLNIRYNERQFSFKYPRINKVKDYLLWADIRRAAAERTDVKHPFCPWSFGVFLSKSPRYCQNSFGNLKRCAWRKRDCVWVSLTAAARPVGLRFSPRAPPLGDPHLFDCTRPSSAHSQLQTACPRRQFVNERVRRAVDGWGCCE